jgi:squalene-associated FAD-dependent desaturase
MASLALPMKAPEERESRATPMKRRVLIIGGGPAGLTAALRLSIQGYAVTLLEQGSELGGRLVHADADTIPPVLMGCQQASLSLLKTLGTAHRVSFPRRLRLEFLLPGTRAVPLRRPWAPAPFHSLLSLATFGGLSLQDRWRLLTFLERTWEGDPPLPSDLESRPADEWLAGIGQSQAARERVWTPLARFLVGDDLAAVSAAMLCNQLTRCFLSSRRHSRLAIPGCGIRALLLEPVRTQLMRSGAVVRLETAVDQIRFDTHRVSGVQLRTGEVLTAGWYLSALAPRQLTRLLPERVLTRFAYFQQIAQLSDIPALTVHLWLEQVLRAPRLLLLAERTFHWVISRTDPESPCQRSYLSLIATGRADLLARPDQELLELALSEIGYAFPAAATAKTKDYRIVRQPRAFLSVGPGTAALRPLPQSPFPNLLLAGDWTDTGLPATLESAIRSGDLCAQAIAGRNGDLS